MTANTGLRYTIEHKIGKQIMDRIHENKDEKTGPTMIPPIPESKFIDKLPDGVLEGQNIREKEHQDAYEAEVKVYRCLENIKQNYLVLHQSSLMNNTLLLSENTYVTERGAKRNGKSICVIKNENRLKENVTSSLWETIL